MAASISVRWGSALALCAVAASAANAECRLHPVTPVGSTAQANGQTIRLGVADDAIRPVAWQGPLMADACTLDLGIIEGPLMMTNARMLYVPTYSGSVRRLFLVDLKACKIRWESAAFSGKLDIAPRALLLGDRRIAIDSHCIPVGSKK